MEGTSIYWIIGVAIVAGGILAYGLETSRKLPVEQRSIRVRKFGAVALTVILFSFLFLSPHISLYSKTENLDELKPEHLTSVEEIAKFEKEQTQNIELLKREVRDLRNELDNVNDYYRSLTTLFVISTASASLNFAFKKEGKR